MESASTRVHRLRFGPSGKAIGVGVAFVSSPNSGLTFSMARVVVTYTPFTSGQLSGNGSRECGDGCPFNRN
jgi:hypothetical protein